MAPTYTSISSSDHTTNPTTSNVYYTYNATSSFLLNTTINSTTASTTKIDDEAMKIWLPCLLVSIMRTFYGRGEKSAFLEKSFNFIWISLWL